jgi:L-ascorbate metabolism protein UlaG (beta-lactamase superfamily)
VEKSFHAERHFFHAKNVPLSHQKNPHYTVMNITYYGHSCFLVDIGGYKILFDPFITPNELAKSIDINSIEADYILISHGHWDHIADAEAIAKRTGATIIASYEITEWFKAKGIEKVHPMNIGGKWPFDFASVKMVSAAHSNSLPDGTYGGSAAGFLVNTADHTFYYSGDTALFSDMKLIGEFYKIDFAFLPIGDNFTMGAHDALLAAKMVNTNKIIAMHYDTFPYIVIDHAEAKVRAARFEKELIMIPIGKSITIK